MQFTIILVSLFAVLLPSEAALRPRASPVPNCYKCPALDNRGHTLKNQQDDGNSGKFHCTYNGGQTCQYNKSDGTESGNDPQNRCPDNAIYICGAKETKLRKKRHRGVPTRRQPVIIKKATIEERMAEVYWRVRNL